MNKLKITAISPLKVEKTDSAGVVTPREDGKANREYFIAKFVDDSNPFAIKEQTRLFWQQHLSDNTATWGALSYDRVKSMIGKTCPGMVCSETVEPYEIDGNTVNTYTAVILQSENKASQFKALGHPLASVEAVDEEVENFDEL